MVPMDVSEQPETLLTAVELLDEVGPKVIKATAAAAAADIAVAVIAAAAAANVAAAVQP